MVLERMNIGVAGMWRCFAGLERRRHAFNIARHRRFCTASPGRAFFHQRQPLDEPRCPMSQNLKEKG
jgi:hypothetical protein